MAVYELDFRDGTRGQTLWVGLTAYDQDHGRHLQWHQADMYESVSCDPEYAAFIPLNWIY